jgi:hypothetical protein
MAGKYIKQLKNGAKHPVLMPPSVMLIEERMKAKPSLTKLILWKASF